MEVNERVESQPDITISINKFKSHKFDKPKSTEFEKVKPILKDLFNDYYNYTLKQLYEAVSDEGEYYIINTYKDCYQVEYYSIDNKNKRKLQIDFNEDIRGLWLSVYSYAGYKGRPMARKNGQSITFQIFKNFLKLTLKFLSDHDSFQIYLETFIKGFYQLVSGDTQIEGFDITSEKAFKNIISQLEKRKAHLEKRLIEEDDITKENRVKLRGELEGINYSLKTINLHK